MKTSTIKKLFRDKIKSWLNSITDASLVKQIEKDVLICGGAIASGMLGEKINDYDIYFRTQSTAHAVALYYVDVFNNTNELKMGAVAKSIAPSVKIEPRTNCKGVEESRVIIYMKSSGIAAEGQTTYQYFENKSESEVDDFMTSLQGDTDMAQAQSVADIVKDKKTAPYRPVFMSENAITLTDKVQLVMRFSGEPGRIYDNYDFAHAMCSYDYENDKLDAPAEALECMLSKTLVYKGSLYPVASVFRIRKFIERGWRITAGQMLKILFQISELDLKDLKVLREQLLGVDQAYMHQLLRAIETKDTGVKVDATYLAKLIDEIFE